MHPISVRVPLHYSGIIPHLIYVRFAVVSMSRAAKARLRRHGMCLVRSYADLFVARGDITAPNPNAYTPQYLWKPKTPLFMPITLSSLAGWWALRTRKMALERWEEGERTWFYSIPSGVAVAMPCDGSHPNFFVTEFAPEVRGPRSNI